MAEAYVPVLAKGEVEVFFDYEKIGTPEKESDYAMRIGSLLGYELVGFMMDGEGWLYRVPAGKEDEAVRRFASTDFVIEADRIDMKKELRTAVIEEARKRLDDLYSYYSAEDFEPGEKEYASMVKGIVRLLAGTTHEKIEEYVNR